MIALCSRRVQWRAVEFHAHKITFNTSIIEIVGSVDIDSQDIITIVVLLQNIIVFVAFLTLDMFPCKSL